MPQITAQALASITDEGLFEQLATAVLREANPAYHALAHPGVNAKGQTVKAPVDGICFVPGANPPHLIAAQHTITKRADLEKKWLHDPAKVKPRNKAGTPTAPEGDVIKTAHLVAQERVRSPNLKATLILTTNEEPPEALVRLVAAAGQQFGLEIDIWPRSRICHELVVRPTGQWLRSKFLGISQERLSPELLLDLSTRSLDAYTPPDEPRAWVQRALDGQLASSLRGHITFLIADSGLGKSVACHRHLRKHVADGGYAIVLSHQSIAASQTLDQALLAELRQLQPSLEIGSNSPLAICSPERPLLITVEDINRSGQPQALLEKIIGWRPRDKEPPKSQPAWCLICPLWPDVAVSLGEEARKRIESMSISAGTFSEAEGTAAVAARAHTEGRDTSPLAAQEISQALGHDPLLIALYDPTNQPDPLRVVGQFVEGAVARVSRSTPEHPATDYREALRVLAAEMLRHRQLDVRWADVRSWPAISPESAQLLGRLASHGELMRLTGASTDQHLMFRHDRVREWLLVDAAADLVRQQRLGSDIVGEPYFAEVIGSILAREATTPDFLPLVAHANPLALFHAFRLLGSESSPRAAAVLDAVGTWLDDQSAHAASNAHLRWEALGKLAETDSDKVPALVRKFSDRAFSGQMARLRNGDISGGIELCIALEPGCTAPWRDSQISHAKRRYGAELTKALATYLGQESPGNRVIVGALRLAGHIGDPALATAIEACWTADSGRVGRLEDYLWATAQCCGNDAARYLGPICDAWASLPDSSDQAGNLSPRDALAQDQLQRAFRRSPPFAAIPYLVQRAAGDELRSPILTMLVGLDHPEALKFLVEQLGEIQRRLEGTDEFSFFSQFAVDEWRRDNRVMSREGRGFLLNQWQSDATERYVRIQAFALWEATQESTDLQVLRDFQSSEIGDERLADRLLRARLSRGDLTAAPALVQHLNDENRGHWWYFARHVWSPVLEAKLDEELAKLCDGSAREWGKSRWWDDIQSELIMEASQEEAERLLVKHWAYLRYSPRFVQAALYVASPKTLPLAQTALAECPEPAELLKYIGIHMGIKVHGRRGITRQEQILALKPYLPIISSGDRHSFWEVCNERGWWQLRREVLDDAMQGDREKHKWRGMWDPRRAWIELDETISECRAVWLDHWIDDYLRTGVTWGEILETMKTWLDSRRTVEAFALVAAAIRHCGTRADLDALTGYEVISPKQVQELVADTRFAVCRRRLS